MIVLLQLCLLHLEQPRKWMDNTMEWMDSISEWMDSTPKWMDNTVHQNGWIIQ